MELEERVNMEKEAYGTESTESTESSTMNGSDSSIVRETWGGRFESTLTLVGYTVGLGTVWRFPYVCYKNGGGVFLVPYLLFIVICGLPLYYIEVSLGQFSAKNPVQVFSICPLFKGVGVVMLLISFIFIWYYSMVVGWVLFYLVQSFYPTLGWSTCDNAWNTPNCRELFDHSPETPLNLTLNEVSANVIYDVNGTSNHTIVSDTMETAATEFWKYRVLNMSEGIHDMGHIQWHLVGSLFLGWLILFLCLCKGVKSLGKVVYFTVLAPYALLIILFVRSVTMNGAWEGIKLYITPDFKKLYDATIWQDAAVQVFYSLGPAWGGVITMASFNKFHNNAFRDTAITCFADAFTAIFSGLPVFAVLGFLSKETGKPLDHFQSSGPGLVFIAYPEALSRLPFPQLWSVLFFFTLILVGIDTAFATLETLSATIVDIFHLRKYKVQVVAAIVSLLFLLSTPFALSGGYYMFLLTDWYIGTFNLVITGLLESIVVAWIYGAGRFAGDIEMMTGVRPNAFIRLAWCFFMPASVLGITIVAYVGFSPPYYGKDGYVFPDYAVTVGTLIALLPISVAFFGTIFQVSRAQGSIQKRIKTLMSPSIDWVPNDTKTAEQYRCEPYQYQTNFKQWLLIDIFGFKKTISPTQREASSHKEMDPLCA